MTTATMYIEGESWEIMGQATDSFMPFETELTASRSGKIFPSSESKVRTVSIDEIKVDLNEVDDIIAFMTTCGGKRFTATLAIDEDCVGGGREIIYTNCLMTGDAENSIFESKIENFEFGYEQRINKAT